VMEVKGFHLQKFPQFFLKTLQCCTVIIHENVGN